MKKLSLLLLVLIILFLIPFLVNKSKQSKIPTLVNVSGTTYVLTHEPYEEVTQPDESYSVQKKIERYSYPEKNLESNYLEVGTEIYLPKKATESIIIYEKDGSLYVAREYLSYK